MPASCAVPLKGFEGAGLAVEEIMQSNEVAGKVNAMVSEHGLRLVLAGVIESIDDVSFVENMDTETDDAERDYLMKSLSQAIDWCNGHGIR